ncbi:YARHG domain-containing protein [Neolewinella aurantiaca]|uniref:YARHG domain-containing protein n=1 Tax=Neolewinella aurantiaca TaxID=2602767 RepID=A0A5C7FH17_9BACT|nr:YARHG domain-containing protein [Neolewinella aurantiaca]TXF90315.1 YARHG domain-containing protein [Neolewinella aurantiaca]
MFRLVPLLSLLFLISCGNPTRNDSAIVEVEEGTAVPATEVVVPPEKPDAPTADPVAELEGFWVGDFENADEEGKSLYVDEGFYWNRTNKINISLDQIAEGKVTGHSVVAGNDRPFGGTYTAASGGGYTFTVREPGDDRYDGTFSFTVKDDLLSGTWEAYKDIDISKRTYTLEKKAFTYNPDVMLEYNTAFVDWTKSVEKTSTYDMGDEVEEWVTTQFATATDLIYELNASNELLNKSEVENLKRGDLTIIRNTIYARHGYSFKNRPLRLFFDKQEWYIPVHADIRADFTEIEKQNIKLLLKYEKNAAEYYDSFGRG